MESLVEFFAVVEAGVSKASAFLPAGSFIWLAGSRNWGAKLKIDLQKKLMEPCCDVVPWLLLAYAI